jgi:dTDP-4-amino-4,6-dideoxygalactose transaminase
LALTIPIADPGRWFTAHASDVAAVHADVVASGQYILGPQVEAFEREFAEFCQAEHAIAVASGTDALILSLSALNVAGAEVITSAHTAIATIAAIERAGATPVLADIDPLSCCLDPRSVARLIGSRTHAIVAVHMAGHPADLAALGELIADAGVVLVDDCAQAHGARVGGRPVGGIGAAGAFSFYPTKNIGAMGDGGAIVTSDSQLAEKLRQLRQYGWNTDRVCEFSGYNSRMDDLQAAVLRLKLREFDALFQRRQFIAQQYTEALAGSATMVAPRVGTGLTHAFHLYTIEAQQREGLHAFLADRDIQSVRYYERPSYRHPVYAGLRRDGDMHGVEALYVRQLSIPVYPELTDTEVAKVCNALSDWVGSEA